MKEEKTKYNFKKGLIKSIKNNIIIILPYLITYLSTNSHTLSMFGSLLLYFLKNFYEVKNGKKLS